jgi:hypothetical protein
MNEYTDLTDKQLEQKINETHVRLSMAYALGNPSVILALNNHKTMLASIIESRKEEKQLAELVAKSKNISSNASGVIVTSKSESKLKSKKTPARQNTTSSTDTDSPKESKPKQNIVWASSPTNGEEK